MGTLNLLVACRSCFEIGTLVATLYMYCYSSLFPCHGAGRLPLSGFLGEKGGLEERKRESSTVEIKGCTVLFNL